MADMHTAGQKVMRCFGLKQIWRSAVTRRDVVGIAYQIQ